MSAPSRQGPWCVDRYYYDVSLKVSTGAVNYTTRLVEGTRERHRVTQRKQAVRPR